MRRTGQMSHERTGNALPQRFAFPVFQIAKARHILSIGSINPDRRDIIRLDAKTSGRVTE